MNLKSIVIQQLEEDGSSLLLQMTATESDPIIVASPGEIEGTHNGPFHFITNKHNDQYQEEFLNNPRPHRILSPTFQRNNLEITIKSLEYSGIPTLSQSSSFYVLSFPKYAIPKSLSIINPLSPNEEYHRTLIRDNQNNRYSVYVHCMHSHGIFNLRVSSELKIDKVGFPTSEYQDKYTYNDIEGLNSLKYLMSQNTGMQRIMPMIQDFFGQDWANFKDLFRPAETAGTGERLDEKSIGLLTLDEKQLKILKYLAKRPNLKQFQEDIAIGTDLSRKTICSKLTNMQEQGLVIKMKKGISITPKGQKAAE